MHVATATLQSVSPYSQSRYHMTEFLEKESHEDYDKRTWREYAHVNSEGFVFIPPIVFKKCLQEAAKYIAMKIKGKGNATYTKHFVAGVLCAEPLVLPIRKEELSMDGPRPHPGNPNQPKGPRVLKRYPVVHEWSGEVEFQVFDDIITKPIFLEHLEQAGKFIGIGRWRPINGGLYGRFEVKKLAWE